MSRNSRGEFATSYKWEEIMPRLISVLEADPQLTIEQAAKNLQLPRLSVRERLRALDLHQYFNRCIGRKSSLSETDWEKIHQGLLQNKSVMQIARELKKPYSTLNTALHRKQIPLTYQVHRYDNETFVKLVSDLDTDPNLSMGQASRKHQLSSCAVTRYLRSQGRFDLLRRFRKTKGLSKQTQRVYQFTDIVPGPELGIVAQHRKTREWVLSVPPHFLLGQTSEGVGKVKIQVEEGQTPAEAFDQHFMVLRFTPTLETLADYWKIPLDDLLGILDAHAQQHIYSKLKKDGD